MSDVAIRAQGLGKKYLVGHQAAGRERYVALRDVIGRTAKGLLRSAGDMLRGRQLVAGDEIEEFWALKDIDFEIRRGEVVGIIGRNGAGKSTLLKVLSRITEPTVGRVEIKGRVASLLEVGTGFHPELTGRENIYLNGAILGMTRAEIRRKFDEIVDFAGVEKFLDTPVKRYSSGMYVRLAFAVAAHLEPEILVVDEVLAVGDAEFQKKCLGKMKDVADGGRTVLFVSHNMAAVKSLTDRGIVMNQGRVALDDRIEAVVKNYTAVLAAHPSNARAEWRGGRHTTILSVRILDSEGLSTGQYVSGEPLHIEIDVETDGSKNVTCDLYIVDEAKARIGLASLTRFEGLSLPQEPGVYRLRMALGPAHLAAGAYTLDVTTAIVNVLYDHYVSDAASFEVAFSNPGGMAWNFAHQFGHGALALASMYPTRIERINGSSRGGP